MLFKDSLNVISTSPHHNIIAYDIAEYKKRIVEISTSVINKNDECAKMEAALRAVAVVNEENPAKINWNC